MDTAIISSAMSKLKQDQAYIEECWAALRARDPTADGRFFYAVRSTGVYCYPSCAARPALAENVAFYKTRQQAEADGFRPCKRCQPDQPPKTEREAQLVVKACKLIEQADTMPSLADLASMVGYSPHHFHRLFKRLTGVTPKAYADAQRQKRVKTHLAKGASVTATLYESGYNSSSRFYESSGDMLGMPPKSYRAGGTGEIIYHAVARCSLGFVVVARSSRGVCAILMGDEPSALVQDLNVRFPKAVHRLADDALQDTVEQVISLIDHPRTSADISLPLDLRGTVFQRQVWDELRKIPTGKTISYGELAAKIGAPKATRAVASACAANKLAVVVPCHRVVTANGTVSGYRWGPKRKLQLLKAEQD